MRDEEKILIGRIVGLFGVEGWVKLESFAQPRERIFKYLPWFVRRPEAAGASETEFVELAGRAQGKGLVAKLPGVDDRDAAAPWIGAEIRIARAALPRPKRGEYYWVDLEGLKVRNLEGVELGRVSHLFSTGANDVLVVRDGVRERLIPFVTGQFVREVDIAGGSLLVDWEPDF